jgi:hypothetical protein
MQNDKMDPKSNIKLVETTEDGTKVTTIFTYNSRN